MSTGDTVVRPAGPLSLESGAIPRPPGTGRRPYPFDNRLVELCAQSPRPIGTAPGSSLQRGLRRADWSTTQGFKGRLHRQDSRAGDASGLGFTRTRVACRAPMVHVRMAEITVNPWCCGKQPRVPCRGGSRRWGQALLLRAPLAGRPGEARFAKGWGEGGGDRSGPSCSSGVERVGEAAYDAGLLAPPKGCPRVRGPCR